MRVSLFAQQHIPSIPNPIHQIACTPVLLSSSAGPVKLIFLFKSGIVRSCGRCQHLPCHQANHFDLSTRADLPTCNVFQRPVLDTQLISYINSAFVLSKIARPLRPFRRSLPLQKAPTIPSNIEAELTVQFRSYIHPHLFPGDIGEVGKSCGEVRQTSPDIKIWW